LESPDIGPLGQGLKAADNQGMLWNKGCPRLSIPNPQAIEIGYIEITYTLLLALCI